MKYLRFFSLLLLSFFTGSLFAQTGAIQGHIFSDNQTPLSGITIALDGFKQITATDNEGFFYFSDIQPGKYIIVATGVGYTARSQAITVAASQKATVDLQLDPKINELQEVVVKTVRSPKTTSSSVTRINAPLKDLPQHIQAVDRVTMNEQQSYTVDDAFKNVAGVNTASIYGSYYIRGFETYSTSFLTNGLKGTPYPEGVLPLLGNIEKVEVIHGPTAILYGEGALGGNINMVTKQPQKTTAVNASVGGGSFDLFRVMGDVTGSINKKKSIYFLAGAGYQKGGRFTDNFNNRNLQLYGSLKWEASAKTSLQLNANYVNDRSTSNYAPDIPVLDGLPLFSLPDNFTYLASDNLYKGNSYQFQLSLNHSFSNNWKGNLLVAYSEGRSDRRSYSLNWDYDPVTTALSRAYQAQKVYTPTTTINPYISGYFKLAGMQHKIIAGADISFDRSIYPEGIRSYNADSFYINAPSYAPGKAANYNSWSSRHELFTYNTAAGYVQDLIEIVPKLKLLAGLRYTNYYRRLYAYDDNLDPIYDERPEITEAVTPRAGLVYQPFKQLSFYADYNRGFEPQYSNYRDMGGPFDPETSNQFEAGVKGEFLNQRLQATVAAYHINKTNVLVYYEDASLPRGYGYRPLQEVVSKGIEVSVTGAVARGLYVIANYSYNETKINKSDKPEEIGTGFYNAPSTNTNGWLSYNFSDKLFKGLNIGFGASFIGKRDTYFGSVPAYTVADAMIAYTLKKYRMQLNCNNLFDKQYAQAGGYVSYTAGAPRNLLVTLSYALK